MISNKNKTRNAILRKFKFGKQHLSSPVTSENIIDVSEDTNDKLGNQLETTIQSMDNNSDINGLVSYKGTHILDNTEPTLRKGNNITIVFYNIIKSNYLPFLLFGLFKNKEDTMIFPNIEYNGGVPSEVVIEELKKVFNQWNNAKFIYKGFLREGNNVYIWIEGTLTENYKILKGSQNDDWWFSMISEIVNNKKILYFPVDNSIINLFVNHPELCYLIDDLGVSLEIPNFAYYGEYYKRIAYAAALGQHKEEPQSAFGPYYYFNSYPRAMRYAIWTTNYKPKYIDGELITDQKGKYTKGGIVRFAIFMGKHNMLLNRDSDPDDDSRFTKILIKKDPSWKESAKTRDSDGKWIKNYDSIGIGNRKYISVNSGESKILYNQQVIKNYNQQFPLTYYYIDTNQNTEDLLNIKIE